MTIWTPKLDDTVPTRYEQIAHAIERDIASGLLKPGTKLPTQRALAKQLNVTVATCGRGYALAAARGLTTLEVGRGSFVAFPAEVPGGEPTPTAGLVTDLGINLPPRIHERDIYSKVLQLLSVTRNVSDLFSALPVETYRRNRDAAAQWVDSRLACKPEDIIICTGMQSALISGLSVITKPGDNILVESHTFPGILTVARMLQLNPISVDMDQRGIVVDDFAAKLKKTKVAYLNPTNQNPTTSVLPVSRRKSIGNLIKKHDAWLIEDDTYGHFFESTPPISRFAPDRCLYVSSLSKVMSVGLRLAFMRVPAMIHSEVLERFRATSFFPSPLSVEIATRWIEDGTAKQLVNQLQEIASQRQQIAFEILESPLIHGKPKINHIWMEVPSPWTADSLIRAARENGVLLSPASLFSPHGISSNSIRIALGAARNDEELKAALKKIVRLIKSPESRTSARY